ncbi:sushi domain-containing protein 1 isoform X1 [Oreochromis niloticus]|uniref:Sushi domain containing 1 n=1 Tax=Oreochromis niloticus TaxID=8128 RepID=I3KFZ9_ORENI|nr:sushi domain-containing protein 1 isoform X1 [Oreochromis niloticus]XP_025752694.1 sushi domain-containing protein 1 isoform X1 [Oreochromis niloticus]
MDEGNKTMIVFFLLFVFSGKPAEGQSLLDVCSTCHANATCDDKSDGSGKVCNCKYGFVGNGRTFCQDKDECQIGSSKICGQHTTCHNTFGSYYCTCLTGYSPSNNMAVFIPNDGTHCQDIDECRITGQCGEGAQCRNLEGSFDCSCQVGYKIYNGVEPFNPLRDKASCKVVDCGPPALLEDTFLLSVTGTTYSSVATFICDEGFVWRRGDNSSVCGAEGLWSEPNMVCEEVDCGSPPAVPHSRLLWNKSTRMGTEVVYQCNSGYHNVGKGNVSICTAAGQWAGPSVLCREILCGNPPVIEFTGQVWSYNSTPGSTVLYFCKDGFYNKGGNNVSTCQENGQWTSPTLSCQEILCGDPPNLPHTGQLWKGSSTPGSTVIYYCKKGFYHSDGNNVSVCTINGYWTKPDISCKEVDCGKPLLIPNSVMYWDKISTVGSKVIYQCKPGYRNAGTGNVSVCSASGKWDAAPILCQEINCWEPVLKPNAKMLWDGTSRVGSVVYYQCAEGYYTRSLRNYSVCGENGLWEDIDLWCEEISCGPPVALPHTNLLWGHSSTPGTTVLYECMEGFYQESGNNMSTCSLSGEWGEVSIKCKAKCGPAPFLANSKVVWHNRSIVIHRCVAGYHSWRGSNVSVCGSSGEWQKATLRCIEIKPPINHLLIFNESCLQWKAEKYEEDTEIYKVTYTGSRDYQRPFYNKRKRFLRSKADQLKLCLSLLPVTNYSITVTATSARFTASVTTNTSLPVPPGPVVYYREFDTPLPTLSLRRSPNTLDLISLYQVFVLPVEGIMMFNCSSPPIASPLRTLKSPAEYITAQFEVHRVGTEMNLTIGDGLLYGGFHNAPLESGKNYYIILRAVSQWKSALKSSCVLWAKVTATSYALRVSSLSAVATIGLVAVVIWGGYSITWCFKKT